MQNPSFIIHPVTPLNVNVSSKGAHFNKMTKPFSPETADNEDDDDDDDDELDSCQLIEEAGHEEV